MGPGRGRRCGSPHLRPRGGSGLLDRTQPCRGRAVANDIIAAGGSAETAHVDALDEEAIEKQASAVVKEAGGIDISFNAIGIPQQGIQGIPLTELRPKASRCRSRHTCVRIS